MAHQPCLARNRTQAARSERKTRRPKKPRDRDVVEWLSQVRSAESATQRQLATWVSVKKKLSSGEEDTLEIRFS